jgi:endonuclease/exonuclease/phosphatase family metal-dependent hydrolase
VKLTLASYNIQYGIGQDGSHDLDRIVAAVRHADIVAIQEVVQHWSGNDGLDLVEELGHRLNYYTAFGSTLNVDASIVGPDGRIANRRRTFGNMVASRWPIAVARTIALPKRRRPRRFDLQRSALEATVLVPDHPMRVYSVHLSHVDSNQRIPQIQALLRSVAEAPDAGTPWDAARGDFPSLALPGDRLPEAAVLMGDFNFTPGDREYKLICGTPSRRPVPATAFDQFGDAWILAGNRAEVGRSYMPPNPPGYRLDHCFVAWPLADRVRRAWIDETALGSDHYPLFVELEL